jgi:ketosteroid isomerase-like protein
MTDLIAELRLAERRLQQAQRSADVAELDRLLDDRLIFTGPPDGGHSTKSDDLRAHGSGDLVMTRVDEEDLQLVVDGRTGVTWALVSVEGSWSGTPFAARVRYTRTWIHDDEHGWRILAAHASPA